MRHDSLTPPVHRFAAIMSALADPFANRGAILGAHGHDAASWAGIERDWTARIHQDASGDLGRAYAEAFSRAARRNDVLARPDADPRLSMPAPPFEPAAEESYVREARAIRRIYEPPIRPDPAAARGETRDVPSFAGCTPALPFQPPRLISRLHRFDSQTGALLPDPIWVDDPVVANDPTEPV